MFDFSFSELLIIAVVALIVVGPERLPKVARTAGHLLGRMQRYVNDVKSDIKREMQLEDLKKLQDQIETQARELEQSMREQVAVVEGEVHMVEKQLSDVPAEPEPTKESAEQTAAPVDDAQLELGFPGTEKIEEDASDKVIRP